MKVKKLIKTLQKCNEKFEVLIQKHDQYLPSEIKEVVCNEEDKQVRQVRIEIEE